jgi:polysaccharide deacetylase
MWECATAFHAPDRCHDRVTSCHRCLDCLHGSRASGGVSARGHARHLAVSRGRCGSHAARWFEEFCADPAARGPRGGADLRRRPVAVDDAAGLGDAGEECVRATFFLIGKPASEHPELVRRIAAEGHTVGHHTWSHRSLMRIKPGETTEEIDHGISAVETVLHGIATTTPNTPFFRFPGFEPLRPRSICCNRAASWCSAPTFGPATGNR